MKKAYMMPEVEKLTFDYSENVTASFAKTHLINDYNPTCESEYDFGDAPQTCGSQYHTSSVAWYCTNDLPKT